MIQRPEPELPTLRQLERPSRQPSPGERQPPCDPSADALVLVGGLLVARFRPRSLSWRLLVAAMGERAATREALYERVWQLTYRPPSSDNALYVAVHRLRAQLAGTGVILHPTEGGSYRVTAPSPVRLVGPGGPLPSSPPPPSPIRLVDPGGPLPSPPSAPPPEQLPHAPPQPLGMLGAIRQAALADGPR